MIVDIYSTVKTNWLFFALTYLEKDEEDEYKSFFTQEIS